MRTLDGRLIERACSARWLKSAALGVLLLGWFGIAGCTRDAGQQALETDANGFFCQNCKAKFCTARKVFLEAKCPQCQQFTIVDVAGYFCAKDQHVTVRPKVSGPEGAAVCDQCGAALKNALVLPRQKDLLAWGASKTAPK